MGEKSFQRFVPTPADASSWRTAPLPGCADIGRVCALRAAEAFETLARRAADRNARFLQRDRAPGIRILLRARRHRGEENRRGSSDLNQTLRDRPPRVLSVGSAEPVPFVVLAIPLRFPLDEVCHGMHGSKG